MLCRHTECVILLKMVVSIGALDLGLGFSRRSVFIALVRNLARTRLLLVYTTKTPGILKNDAVCTSCGFPQGLQPADLLLYHQRSIPFQVET